MKTPLLDPKPGPKGQRERFKDSRAVTDLKNRPGLALLPVVYAVPGDVGLESAKVASLEATRKPDSQHVVFREVERDDWRLLFVAAASNESNGGTPLRHGEALSKFASLHDVDLTKRKDRDRVLRFARRYGPLHICEHEPGDGRESAWPGWRKFWRCEHCTGPDWQERVADWIYFSREVNAMLTIRLALKGIENGEGTVREFLFLDDIECLPEANWPNRKSASNPMRRPNLEAASDEELRAEARTRMDARARGWVAGNIHHKGISVGTGDDPDMGIELGNRVTSLAGALTLDLSGAMSGDVEYVRCTAPGCMVALPRKKGPRAKCKAHHDKAHRVSNRKWSRNGVVADA